MESFNKNVTSAMRIKGNRVLKNDLIKEININVDEDSINIDSLVVSESLFSEYGCELEFDSVTKEVIGTHCSCLDFEKNEFKKDNYCCKHITATFYEFLNRIDNDTKLRSKLTSAVEDNTGTKQSSMNSGIYGHNLLNSLIEDEDKQELKFEITLNKNNWSSKIQAEFKIGLKSKSNKMYMMRDINNFILSMYNKIPIKYGKDFTFDIRNQKLSYEDKRLIKFICNIKNLSDHDRNFRRQDKLIDGKTMTVPDILFKEFLLIVKNHRIYLGDGFFYRILESEIIMGDMPIPFSLESNGDSLILEVKDGMPESLTQNEDVFLYGTTIYIPSIEQCERLSPYLKAFNSTKSISFDKAVLFPLSKKFPRI